METEIKIAPVLPHQAALVLADPCVAPYISAPQKIRMHSEYFDTAEGELARMGFALRLRRENGDTVCALKGPSALPHTRLEIEARAESLADGVLALLKSADVPLSAAQILQSGALQKTCSLTFTREMYLYKKDGLTVELCHDEGQSEKGASLGSICELELELKTGEYAQLDALADLICGGHGLSRSGTSKREQAMALGQAQSGRAVNPFFVGAEMLNFCVRSKYIELVLGGDKQLRYVLTALGERELPRLFGVSFDKPCAFTGAESEE